MTSPDEDASLNGYGLSFFKVTSIVRGFKDCLALEIIVLAKPRINGKRENSALHLRATDTPKGRISQIELSSSCFEEATRRNKKRRKLDFFPFVVLWLFPSVILYKLLE